MPNGSQSRFRKNLKKFWLALKNGSALTPDFLLLAEGEIHTALKADYIRKGGANYAENSRKSKSDSTL